MRDLGMCKCESLSCNHPRMDNAVIACKNRAKTKVITMGELTRYCHGCVHAYMNFLMEVKHPDYIIQVTLIKESLDESRRP